MLKRGVRTTAVGVIVVCILSYHSMIAWADSSLQSAHYQFVESVLGGGGLVQSNSANYQVTESIGDPLAGGSASTNYQVQAGSKTTNDPALSLTVNGASTNFGSFSPSSATVTTSTFTISDYTSYGYAVQILGTPPTSGAHAIASMATTGTSQSGIEQFGINLVANTSPTSVGANPAYGPFGVGAAASNYGTSNQYRYVSGETIATGPKSSGATTYTISYIVNVSSLTPGGQYTSNQTIICTGTY